MISSLIYNSLNILSTSDLFLFLVTINIYDLLIDCSIVLDKFFNIFYQFIFFHRLYLLYFIQCNFCSAHFLLIFAIYEEEHNTLWFLQKILIFLNELFLCKNQWNVICICIYIIQMMILKYFWMKSLTLITHVIKLITILKRIYIILLF